MKLCLIISDNPDNRIQAREVIMNFGFLCIEVEEREDAFTACQAMMPDIILLDTDDDHDAESDFITRLRAVRKGSRPLIFCCGDDDSRAHELMKAGLSGYLARPLDSNAMGFKLLQLGAIGNQDDVEAIAGSVH